jgi:hypothetical protein
MGEQDIQNTFINMMIDKTYGSLLPYGLSSDLDDLIEDDTLAPNKIRKVGDINKWKFDTLPGVSTGEFEMFQLINQQAQSNSGLTTQPMQTPKGGKLTARQILLQQQQLMQKITFPMNFLEDGERDRTELRISHLLQFYTIPKIERITGKKGAEVEQLIYRDIKLNDVQLHDGRTGSRIIKLVDPDMAKDENSKQMIADDLSVLEEMGEQSGVPTEALAVPISMFEDFNLQVQIVKNSSYERNQALDQAMRQDYAQWRLSLSQIVPVNAKELVAWVDESYDIDSSRFEVSQQQTQDQQQQMIQQLSGGGQPQQQQGQGQPQQQPGPVKPPNKATQMAPGGVGALAGAGA